METENAGYEEQVFSNVAETRQIDQVYNHTGEEMTATGTANATGPLLTGKLCLYRNEKKGSGNREGHGKLSIDPLLKDSKIPTEKGFRASPFWLDLGHELGHTQHYLTNGESVYDIWVEHPDRPDDPIRQSEKYATHIENINIMRAQAGMPLRTHYATQGNGGYEPTRILNANGGSIFYNVSINFQGKELKSNVPQIYRILYKKK